MPEQVFELWAENLDALRLFEAMCSQWRTGPNGAVGLDYEAIPRAAEGIRMSKRRVRRAFAGLQVMEAEALRLFADKRKDG